MKKRGKIALSIAVCTICLAFLVVGVYAKSDRSHVVLWAKELS